MEFSGRNANGKRVIGLVPGGALATSVLAHKDLVWQVPESWSLEEACTVPRTYSLVSTITMFFDYYFNNCCLVLSIIFIYFFRPTTR